MKKILVPVDGMETCQKTFETAISLSEKFGSELVVLYVKPVIDPLSHPGYVALEEHSDIHIEDIAKDIANKATEKLSADGRIVHTIVESGDPASIIIDVASREACDMIVMCTHGMGAMKRFFLGSVTNKVVHHAEVPVLVVR
jgi:nucleotide-binding universal stress UspA family protein